MLMNQTIMWLAGLAAAAAPLALSRPLYRSFPKKNYIMEKFVFFHDFIQKVKLS